MSRATGYGMGLAWPPAPPVLHEALALFRRIQKTWRGTDIVRQIPEAQRPVYRMKIRAYDMLHGKKPWAPNVLPFCLFCPLFIFCQKRLRSATFSTLLSPRSRARMERSCGLATERKCFLEDPKWCRVLLL